MTRTEEKRRKRIQERATGRQGGPRPKSYYYTEQQLQEDPRAFCFASSSSACAAHTGAARGVRNTLSRFFSSFSCSMASLRFIIVVRSESKSWSMPASITEHESAPQILPPSRMRLTWLTHQ